MDSITIEVCTQLRVAQEESLEVHLTLFSYNFNEKFYTNMNNKAHIQRLEFTIVYCV